MIWLDKLLMAQAAVDAAYRETDRLRAQCKAPLMGDEHAAVMRSLDDVAEAWEQFYKLFPAKRFEWLPQGRSVFARMREEVRRRDARTPPPPAFSGLTR